MIDIEYIITNIGPRIDDAANRFFIPLQTNRVIKREAFGELSVLVRELTKALKGHDLVPKALLNRVYYSIQLLRNEALYFKGETAALEDMANQLEMSLGLIFIGESHEDRVPGVPRIL